jgi:hypothetical protein
MRRYGAWATREHLYVMQFELAFLAKLAILHSSDLRHETLDENALFELLALCGNLDEAFLHQGQDEAVLWSYFLRTAWLQFPWQSSLGYVLPRHWVMFRRVNDAIGDRPFDVPSAWSDLSGLVLEDAMVLGLLLWTQTHTRPFFETVRVEGPGADRLRLLMEEGRLTRALALAGTDYQGFRELQGQYDVADPLYAKTEFNALVKRPLITTPRRGWTAPIPRLVMERFTGGIFFDLVDAFSGTKRNEFLDYFGTLFEEYAGMLMRDGWGTSNVIHEPRYGKEEKRGPDWIVLEGERALLFECKSSRLRLPTKAVADQEAVRADIRRMFIEPLKRYPKKIQDLQSGSAGVDLTGVKKFYPCVAVAEKIYLEPIYREIIDKELRAADMQPFEYYLIDIQQLETFSGWAAQMSVADILDGWSRGRLEEPPTDFDVWIGQRAKEMNLGFECPLLTRALEEFRSSYLAPNGVAGARQ